MSANLNAPSLAPYFLYVHVAGQDCCDDDDELTRWLKRASAETRPERGSVWKPSRWVEGVIEFETVGLGAQKNEVSLSRSIDRSIDRRERARERERERARVARRAVRASSSREESSRPSERARLDEGPLVSRVPLSLKFALFPTKVRGYSRDQLATLVSYSGRRRNPRDTWGRKASLLPKQTVDRP